MNDSAPTLGELRRIAAIIRAAGPCASFQFEQGAIAIEVARDGWPAAAQCAPAVGPVDSAPAAATPVTARSVTASVAAPSVGTFRASRPADAGDHVTAGTELGAVDVLGELVPVVAPVTARIAGVLVAPGAPVEYGQPLFLLQEE